MDKRGTATAWFCKSRLRQGCNLLDQENHLDWWRCLKRFLQRVKKHWSLRSSAKWVACFRRWFNTTLTAKLCFCMVAHLQKGDNNLLIVSNQMMEMCLSLFFRLKQAVLAWILLRQTMSSIMIVGGTRPSKIKQLTVRLELVKRKQCMYINLFAREHLKNASTKWLNKKCN